MCINEKKYWTSKLESEEEIDKAVDILFDECMNLLEDRCRGANDPKKR